MSTGLSTVAGRGAATSLFAQLVRWGLQIVSIVVLARMLAPGDYGLLAMVLALVGVGEVLRDLGLSTAAIQAERLTNHQRTNLFWLNSSIGLSLTIVVLIAQSWISNFYGDPRLSQITTVLAFTFIVNGLSTQLRANLVRSLRFVALNVCETVAQAAALGIAITLAALNVGYMALAWQQLAQVVLMFVGFTLVSDWRPGLPRRHVGTMSLLHFGGTYALTQIMVYLSQNASSVVLGQAFGPSQLGAFNRAQQLCQLPLAQVTTAATQVALPTLSRLQSDPTKLRKFLTSGATGLCVPLTSLFAVGALYADIAIPLTLGDQWASAVPIFSALCVAAIFQTLGFPTFWFFVSQGRVQSNLKFSVITRAVITLATVIAAGGGAVTCAVAIGAGAAFSWVLGLLWIRRFDSPTVDALARLELRILAFAIGPACLGLAVRLAWPGSYDWFAALAVHALGVIIWLAFDSVLRSTLAGVRTAMTAKRTGGE